MAKVSKKSKKEKNKKSEKYNADNEIIIGVTTKPKEKVRVEKKATRTNKKKEINNKKNKDNKNTKKSNGSKKKNINNKVKTEAEIKKINRRKIIISTTALLFLALCGTIYYLTTPVFNISSVAVYGNHKNSTDTYISLSKININETNIFAFTKSSIENRLKENPYVEQVEIKRKLPNYLELYITERNVDYQINCADTYIYLNNQGYLLEINEEKQDVPTIKGLTALEEDIKVGQRLGNEDLLKLDTVLKIINYIKYNNVESKLTSINVTDISNYTLNFDEEGKTVFLGDCSSITEKMSLVANILKAEEGKKGEIHATENELKRNRVYFSEIKEK